MTITGWRHITPILALAMLAACGGGDRGKTAATSVAVPPPPNVAAGAGAACPVDGNWHECSVMERLEQAGLAPHRDSTAVHESAIVQPGILLHVGSATLEIFLFPDEGARKAVEAKLDTTKYVAYNQEQTGQGEPSLIHAQNLLAILNSRRDSQRERVGDALTAGAPQPHGR